MPTVRNERHPLVPPPEHPAGDHHRRPVRWLETQHLPSPSSQTALPCNHCNHHVRHTPLCHPHDEHHTLVQHVSEEVWTGRLQMNRMVSSLALPASRRIVGTFLRLHSLRQLDVELLIHHNNAERRVRSFLFLTSPMVFAVTILQVSSFNVGSTASKKPSPLAPRMPVVLHVPHSWTCSCGWSASYRLFMSTQLPLRDVPLFSLRKRHRLLLRLDLSNRALPAALAPHLLSPVVGCSASCCLLAARQLSSRRRFHQSV